jgi:hypothetical protein
MSDQDIADARIALEHIDGTLKTRWWLFGGMAIAIILNSVATCSNMVSMGRLEKRSITADVRSIENKAAIDAAIKQQVIYQQQLVQYWDALAKKNPKVNVPRVIVHPPNPSPSAKPDNAAPLSDAELTRSPSAKPTPAHHTVSKSTHKRNPKPTASPGIIDRLFKPKSTR